ncbi:RHS repeat-associated core domain-containing protein, partial [Mucilaginibacter panaciglaebae]|uniref:RHS repeat-associated core domain-containing protein n=1 Tax=Mucilaginibacter panaciglaebae TaxID=502331 RepID=UPI0031EADE72
EIQPELSLNTYDFGARNYNPVLARWLTMDPLSVTYEDETPYGYVGNNPLNMIDPDGMQYDNGGLPIPWAPTSGPTVSAPTGSGSNSWAGAFGWGAAGANAAWQGVNAFNAFKTSHTTFENFGTVGRLQGNVVKTATISQWQPNGYDKWKSTPYIGKLTYGIVDDAWVTVRSIFWPGGEVRHLTGESATPRDMQSAFAFTAASFVPIGKTGYAIKEAAESFAEHGAVDLSEKIGWKVGDPITNLTPQGKAPVWSTVRQRFWKNEALTKGTEYSESNLIRMRKGLAPQFRNATTGAMESMELHHTIPQRSGGLFDFIKVTPEQHRIIDPFRR